MSQNEGEDGIDDDIDGVDEDDAQDAAPTIQRGPVGPVIKRMTAKLQVRFTQAQRTGMHEEILDLRDEKAKIDGWFADQRARYKADMQRAEERMDDLHRKLRAGYESQDVMTRVQLDPDDHDFVQIVREDTGEVIKRRPALPNEMQATLEGIEPPAGGHEEVEAAPEPEPGTALVQSRPQLAEVDLIVGEGYSAHDLMLDGQPVEVYGCPYPKDSDEASRWQTGYNLARDDYEMREGFLAETNGLPEGEDESEAFKAGRERSRAVKATISEPDAPAAAVPQSDDERDLAKLVAGVREMNAEQLAAYLDGLDRDVLLALHVEIVGRVVGKPRSTTLAKAIISKIHGA